MPYTTITTEGGLLPVDILDAIATEELPGQRAEDFGLEKSRRLGDEIAAAWGDIRVFWDAFQRGLRRLRESDTATSITREQWMIPFLRALGYELKYLPSAAVVEGRTYAISHRAGQHDDAPPVHIEGLRTSLDARPPTGRPRLSPHALVQEYLNSTEHVWGIVTNGERLRLLRDSSRMTRPAYVEFDLRAMLEGEKFSEFALLYRLLHRSRLPHSLEDATTCLLESYHQRAVEAGGRVREKLRDGVEQALRLLGNGLLQHPTNTALRAKLAAGAITPLEFYRQLLRLVYRLLFLMVAEERNLIAAEDNASDLLSPLSYRPSANDRLEIYRQHYSIGRLRRMAEQRGVGRGPYDDLWLGLMQTFQLLEGSDEERPRTLGLAPLDGDLFSQSACEHLTEGTRMRNADLLQAIGKLSLYHEQASRTLRRVNYAALDVEELGSVYESLLDFRPVIEGQKEKGKRQNDVATTASDDRSADPFSFDLFTFSLASGSERKTTGSYYTRPELVHELIKSALDPVIEERLRVARDKETKRQGDKESGKRHLSLSPGLPVSLSEQEQTLLSIRVIDPAAGSGHFLLAAARRIGRALAKARSGEEQPTPSEFRRAVRDVIQHCIYGVDLNPLAVDLCKLALWIEGHNAGMPLSFLDHHVKQGNSLIGATRALVAQGIPDDAYKAVTGDDKKVASEIKKRNKAECERYLLGYDQRSLFEAPTNDGGAALADALRQLDDMSAGSVAEVRAKAARYRQVRTDAEVEFTHFNLWTAAFFQPLTSGNAPHIPTTQTLADHERNPRAVRADVIGAANGLAAEAGFFHWELEFPQVFDKAKGKRQKAKDDRDESVLPFTFSLLPSEGFDVVLGNPPWERIKLQEQEHWVDVPEVRDAPNKAAREKMIQSWRASDDPAKQTRVAQFDAAKYRAEAESRFVRASQRFPLTAVGDVNTYALFAEHARDLLAPTGRAGIIVPTGIATDDTTKAFFGALIEQGQLTSLYDFENREDIFPGVGHGRFKFSLMTLGATEKPIEFVFFATNVTHLSDPLRRFSLSPDEINLLNPNTRTCPIFRSQVDAVLSKQIYSRTPVLMSERKDNNPWGISFLRMFDMTNDSNIFQSTLYPGLLPLYEGRMIWFYDHRFGSFDQKLAEYLNMPDRSPETTAKTEYFVPNAEIVRRLAEKPWKHNWFFGIRRIARNTDERTIVGSFVPGYAVSYGLYLIFTEIAIERYVCLATMFNSIVLDYLCRASASQPSLTYGLLYQLPVLPPSAFSETDIAFIVPRVLELVYTAWDMRPFAEDVWEEVKSEKEKGKSGAAELLAELLRRNAECNRDAPRELFPAPPGIAADGSVDFSHLPFDCSENAGSGGLRWH